MKKIIITIVLLSACGYGAYRHFTAPPGALDVLANVPESFPAGSEGGIQPILPNSQFAAYREPGRHTVIVVSATWCGPCRQLAGHLKTVSRLRPDVAIRKIDVDEAGGWEAVRQRCGIDLAMVPHVVIYGADGELLVQDVGRDKDGLESLIDWMNAELRQAYQR